MVSRPRARDSLEAGHDRDDALSQRLAKAALSPPDPRLVWVVSVMMPAWLPVNEAAHASSAKPCTTGHRDPLACGHSIRAHGPGAPAHVFGEPDQSVGGLAHGTDQTITLVPVTARAGDVVRHRPRIRSASPTEVPPVFLDN